MSKEAKNMANTKWRETIRKKADKVFGTKCFFCGIEYENKRLLLHEKTGKYHKHWLTSLIALKNPDEWVRLCYRCHTGVHFCMKYLGLSWNEIVKLSQG